MDRFEKDIREVFDFNRFELQPEMAKLLGDFEKTYLGGEKDSGRREPISFDELLGGETTETAVTKPAGREQSTERDKGKSR